MFAVWLLLVARHGHSDAEGDQQPWVMHQTWRHLCQGPHVAHHCNYTFRVATCWLYQHWDHNGFGSTPKHGEPVGLFHHLTKHIMAYMTPIQTAKTVAKFLDKDTSQLLEHWPSSWVINGPTLKATSSERFVSLWGYGRLGLPTYHAQSNGQVEWAYQTLMHMIGKSSRDWKEGWLRHLSELVHAYNSMRLAITRYIPHYLMFGYWTCLPIEFYFPTVKDMEKHQHVDHYVAKLCE